MNGGRDPQPQPPADDPPEEVADPGELDFSVVDIPILTEVVEIPPPAPGGSDPDRQPPL
ncbi:MAG: hypothetical protein ACOY42_04030 [Pseudomonadota bacterium]|jgi:hypothetical protein